MSTFALCLGDRTTTQDTENQEFIGDSNCFRLPHRVLASRNPVLVNAVMNAIAKHTKRDVV